MMAVPSRRASPRSSSIPYKETDAQPETNEYERERDRQKKALHDRVELALLQSGFAEAAALQGAFSGEGGKSIPASAPSKKRRRHCRLLKTTPKEPRHIAKNVGKNVAAVPPIGTSIIVQRHVCQMQSMHAGVSSGIRVPDEVLPNIRGIISLVI
jgi:hypothetical protein